MNYCGKGFSIICRIRLYNPHTRVSIWQFSHAREPIHESTWILGTIASEREEKSDTSNVKTAHPSSIRIRLHKDAVIPGGAFSPRVNRADTLIAHTPNSGNITWGIKGGDSRWVYSNFLAERR